MLQFESRGKLPLLFLSLLLSSAEAGSALPQKAFAVEGGTVSVIAGVMPNPQAPAALPFGKLKYPTRYFIELGNESPFPIWIDATWTFPGKTADKSEKPKAGKGEKTPPGGTYWYYFDKLGVLVDQPIVVDIHAYSDAQRTTLVGSQKAELRFDQADVDRFLANFPSPYKNQTESERQASVLSGWHDIPVARIDVAGTQADAQLQRDIQAVIWKTDSTLRWDCDREVLSATPISVDESQILSRRPEESRIEVATESMENGLKVERWAVKSCGQEFVYEVLMSAASSGGTDVIVFNTTDAFDSTAEAPEATGVEP